MFELQDVGKSYGSVVALQPTSLTIPDGKTTVLIGPSGCGKSTLLRLLIGLLTPSRGRVLFEGQPVTTQNALAVRREVGYVIQDGGLFPHLTAEANITLAARHFGVEAGEIKRRVEHLAKLTQLDRKNLARYPVELSGGQRQRVALMRALMLQPKALLLDEPLGALDPMIRAALQEDLKKIFAELNQTVVLVTHDMGEAGYLGDQIVLLKDGRIIQQGTLSSFQEAPSDPFVTQFLNAQRSLVAL